MRILTLAAIAGSLVAVHAQAAPLTTLSFTGTTYSITDLLGGFGAPSTTYGGGLAIAGTFSYDPTAIGSCSNLQSCSYTITPASNAAETVTFNGKTVSFVLTSGSIQLNQGGGNAQQIGIYGSGPNSTNVSLTLQDTNKLLSSTATPGLVFNPVTLTSGSDSSNQAGLYLGFSVQSVSAVSAVTSITEVPEPASLLLLGAGLTGAALSRRRRRRASV